MSEFVSRTESRSVPCPLCEAQPGQPCWGARGTPRDSSHAERVSAFLAERRASERAARAYDAVPLPLDELEAMVDRDPPRPLQLTTEQCRTGLEGVARCRAILDDLRARRPSALGRGEA